MSARYDTARVLAAYRGRSAVQGERPSPAEVVRRYAPLVYRIARRVRRRTGFAVELEDLVAEGTIGLLQAAERYDPDAGSDFEHLATVRVHGAMLDALRRLDPLSQRRRREARRHERVRERLRRELEREPSGAEMAEALGIDLDTYVTLERELSLQPATSMEDMARELDDPRAPLPDQIASARERVELLREAIEGLPERPRLVLSLIYFNELSQKEVARVLEVSEARISQIHKEALGKLRRRLAMTARPGEDAW